ncbi:hypothetical protein PENSPDRAFT_185250 [Peniophora sp. CONT]|nr:hypothetical protein PENSPDRAFT_185250 [Peniophora sp. CONT]
MSKKRNLLSTVAAADLVLPPLLFLFLASFLPSSPTLSLRIVAVLHRGLSSSLPPRSRHHRVVSFVANFPRPLYSISAAHSAASNSTQYITLPSALHNIHQWPPA